MTNDVEALAAAIWTLHGRVKELQWPIVLRGFDAFGRFLRCHEHCQTLFSIILALWRKNGGAKAYHDES